MTKPLRFLSLATLALLLVITACSQNNAQPASRSVRGELVVDGERRTFVYNSPLSVEELLRRENISLNPLDDVSPALHNQVTDGMTITVVRVTEERVCEEQVEPFEERRLPRADLEPGETRIAQQGQNGLVEVCERVVYRDGEEVSRSQQGPPVVLEEPVDGIVYVGVEDTLEPVAIEGTLAYLSARQAWIIQGSSTSRRPITLEGGLDGRVFELAPDGRKLLYTKTTTDPEDAQFTNELWLIPDILSPEPTFLQQIDILTAAWRPGAENTITYSGAAPGGGFAGWSAFNDLWSMQVEPRTGEIIDIQAIIEQNVSGAFASWGTRFAWSPDGAQLAYAKADGVGLVDLADGEFGPFRLAFPYFNAAITSNWVWQPELSWSSDGRWVTTTVHGPPYSTEAPIDSIIFDVAVFEVNPDKENPLAISAFVKQAGIWARPTFSPQYADGSYRIAYLQARSPLNSVGTEYDLMVMDRDGSNRRRIFPPEGEFGLRPRGSFDGEFVWSPSGRQIAIVYQGNIWVVDVESGLAQQVTNDGQASAVRWVE